MLHVAVLVAFQLNAMYVHFPNLKALRNYSPDSKSINKCTQLHEKKHQTAKLSNKLSKATNLKRLVNKKTRTCILSITAVIRTN